MDELKRVPFVIEMLAGTVLAGCTTLTLDMAEYSTACAVSVVDDRASLRYFTAIAAPNFRMTLVPTLSESLTSQLCANSSIHALNKPIVLTITDLSCSVASEFSTPDWEARIEAHLQMEGEDVELRGSASKRFNALRVPTGCEPVVNSAINNLVGKVGEYVKMSL